MISLIGQWAAAARVGRRTGPGRVRRPGGPETNIGKNSGKNSEIGLVNPGIPAEYEILVFGENRPGESARSIPAETLGKAL